MSSHNSDNDKTYILGLYENFNEAVERVNKVAKETEQEFVVLYGDDFVGENDHNGCAGFSATDKWDDVQIKAEEYEVNKDVNYLI